MSDETIQGIAADPIQETYWIYTTAAIYEMVIKNEDKDVWQLYLDKKEYDMALEYCKTSDQRNKVRLAQADQLFSKGHFIASAKYYAMTRISFEQAALKFITRNEKDALRVYLLAKLRQLEDNVSKATRGGGQSTEIDGFFVFLGEDAKVNCGYLACRDLPRENQPVP